MSLLTEKELRRDYYQLNLEIQEIAEKHDCSRGTVYRRMEEYDMERLPKLRVEKKRGGRTYYSSGNNKFAEYQLVAIADGADPHEIFGGANVHHINGCRYDNRKENLAVLTSHEHGFVEHNNFNVDYEEGIIYKNLELEN
jgi:transposase